MENKRPSHQRNAVDSAIARRTSRISARLQGARLEAYKLQNEKLRWHSRTAMANKAQLRRLTLLEKKSSICDQLHEFALRRAAKPKETISNTVSTALSARRAIPTTISWILERMLVSG
jgi:hypothetical protein